mmetsp:Transcript_3358/g.7421  ORF Transcript_3358/g.7421 Transcript_3358/m.7421 type:complete len:120 (+) Transcript_3358:123-482(+)
MVLLVNTKDWGRHSQDSIQRYIHDSSEKFRVLQCEHFESSMARAMRVPSCTDFSPTGHLPMYFQPELHIVFSSPFNITRRGIPAQSKIASSRVDVSKKCLHASSTVSNSCNLLFSPLAP